LGRDFRGAGVPPAIFLITVPRKNAGPSFIGTSQTPLHGVQKWLDSPLVLPESAGPEEIFPHADRFQFSTKR